MIALDVGVGRWATGLLLALAVGACAAPEAPKGGAPEGTVDRKAPGSTGGADAPRGPWPALESAIKARLEGFEGEVGVFVHRPGQPGSVAIRADERFPTASMIKVPIAIAVLRRVAEGALDLDQKLTYTAARAYPGEDLTAALKDGSKVSLRKLLGLMLAYSDNTASLWCQELAGTGRAINAWLAARGFEHTRMNSRTPGREADFKAFGWGQTSPREMASLLVRIRDRQAVRPDLDERLHRELCKSHWDREALSSIPPRVQVASKQGAVSRSRSEVLLVHAPAGDYVLCAITRNQGDRSWGRSNAGFVLLRDLSRLCWSHLGTRR